MNLDERRAKVREWEDLARNLSDREIAQTYAEKAAKEKAAILEIEKTVAAELSKRAPTSRTTTSKSTGNVKGAVAADHLKGITKDVIADAVKAAVVDGEIADQIDKHAERAHARLDRVEARIAGKPRPNVMPAASPPPEPTMSEKAAGFRRIAAQATDPEVREGYLKLAVSSEEKALNPSEKGSAVEIVRQMEEHLERARSYDAQAEKTAAATDFHAYRQAAQSERDKASELRRRILG
jgi:hypothetical protein